MKKLLFTLAILMQSVLVFAWDNAAVIVRATANNVKMYRQAGTAAEVVKSLKSTDEVIMVRKHNTHWTIVTVDDQVGYVLTSELTPPKYRRSLTMASPAHRE